MGPIMSKRLDRHIGRKSTNSGLLLNASANVRKVRLRTRYSKDDPTVAN